MTLAEYIHHLVLEMEGVGTVYSADPAWLTVVKTLVAEAGSTRESSPCAVHWEKTDDGARPTLRVQLRIGGDGSIPAPDLARSVAGRIRSLVNDRHADVDVKVYVQVSAIGM